MSCQAGGWLVRQLGVASRFRGGLFGGRAESNLKDLTHDFHLLSALVELSAAVEEQQTAAAASHSACGVEGGIGMGLVAEEAETASASAEEAAAVEVQGALQSAVDAGLKPAQAEELQTLIGAARGVPGGNGNQFAEWQRLAPKLSAFCTVLAEHFAQGQNTRAIAFVQRRSTVSLLCSHLQVSLLPHRRH